MLFARNESLTRECPKGPKCDAISERISAGLPITSNTLSGTVKLEKRIDDVVGFRVRMASVSQESPMIVGNGSLLALRSSILGSALSLNPYQFAITTNQADSISTNYSDIIGLSCMGVVNKERGFPFEQLNRKMSFVRAGPVQNFDWSLSVVNGSYNLTADFAVEIIIEFYTLCKCS